MDDEERERRAQRKAESLMAWHDLPADKEEEAEKKGPPNSGKVKFQALCFEDAAGINAGWMRPKRLEEFLKAAGVGDVTRMSQIIKQGVDVDGVNECGETAVMAASWQGQSRVVRLLAWAGHTLQHRPFH